LALSSNAIVMNTDSVKHSCCQFHQYFEGTFFIQKCLAKLFSNYSLAFKKFGNRILSKKLFIKCWWNWLLVKLLKNLLFQLVAFRPHIWPASDWRLTALAEDLELWNLNPRWAKWINSSRQSTIQSSSCVRFISFSLSHTHI